MNEEQEKEILNEAKIQTARHKKKIQIIIYYRIEPNQPIVMGYQFQKKSIYLKDI